MPRDRRDLSLRKICANAVHGACPLLTGPTAANGYSDRVAFARNFQLATRTRGDSRDHIALPSIYRQGVLILSDALMVFNEKKLAELTLQNRLPAIFGFREFADMGGLVSYGANLRKQYRRAAWYVAKIVTGTDPGDLPIEQPTHFELVINLKTAKALGLTVPPTLLATADEVIE